eukprot:scaffold7949_cov37-Cyclotella_meneghiniana.AAC.3
MQERSARRRIKRSVGGIAAATTTRRQVKKSRIAIPPAQVHLRELQRLVRQAFNFTHPNIESLKIASGYREGSLVTGKIRHPGQGVLLVSIVQNYDLSRLRLFCNVCSKLYKHNSFNPHFKKCIKENSFKTVPMIKNTANRKRASEFEEGRQLKRTKTDPLKRSRASTTGEQGPEHKRQKRSKSRVNY